MATVGQTGLSFADAHRQMRSDPRIQFELTQAVPARQPQWLEDLINALSPVWEPLFWTILVVAGVVIAVLLARALLKRDWRLPLRADRTAEAETWAPAPEAARALLAEAERLAAAGDHEGAVRLLLRRSVEDISDRLPGFLLPSLTARDIAAASRLPDAARTAFGQIAAIVEAALFARVRVGEAGWRAARDAYGRFAFADAWSGAGA